MIAGPEDNAFSLLFMIYGLLVNLIMVHAFIRRLNSSSVKLLKLLDTDKMKIYQFFRVKKLYNIL